MSAASIDSISSICDLIINLQENSPDLNVIKMIWNIMDNIIAFYNPTTKEDLKEAIHNAWNSIKMETINKLRESFIRRCYLSLKQKGEYIQHLFHSQIIT